MLTLAQRIQALLAERPGLTDREITDTVRGSSFPQQPINSTARALEQKGLVARRKRPDGLVGNYLLIGRVTQESPEICSPKVNDVEALSEDQLKSVLADWLTAGGWTVDVAWGTQRGIDIDARRGAERWIIEAKGSGSRPEMRVNYFIGMLGETLQRMNDQSARYSIALPDLRQYRRLWERLPALAKERTSISAIFVSLTGDVSLVG